MTIVKTIAASLAALFAASLAGTAALAAGEYRLRAGDKVEITAIGVPDLKQRLTVGIDGEISISLIGNTTAAGLTVAELQAKIQQLAGQKTFRLRGPGANEFIVLEPQDVSVSIAEYRPIYVSGDVGKPGSQPFSPGLTSRQAITMAGGCDLTRFGVLNPVLTSADLRSEYERAWIEFATESLRLGRIEAELEGKQQVSLDSAGEIPLAPAFLAGLTAAENEKLRLRTAELKAQKAFYDRQVEILGERAGTLQAQRVEEEKGLRLDEAEANRIAEQARTGISAVNRVADARRVSLLSATRALQIGVAATGARREQAQAVRDGDTLLAKRREELLTEIQDARGRVQSARARLQAAADKLVYTGLFRSQISRGYGDPELTLIRKGDGKVEQLTPEIDAEMSPGDVLQVRCPFSPDMVKLP